MTRPPYSIQIVGEVITGTCTASLFGVRKLETAFPKIQLFMESVRADIPSNATVPLIFVSLFLFGFIYFTSCLPKEK